MDSNYISKETTDTLKQLIDEYCEKDLSWEKVQEFKSKLCKLLPKDSLNYIHLPFSATYFNEDDTVNVVFQAPDEKSDFRLVKYTIPTIYKNI